MASQGFTRGSPRPLIRLFFQCLNKPQEASLKSNAEVWYKREAQVEGDGSKIARVIAHWDCPCGAEHEGEVVRWVL